MIKVLFASLLALASSSVNLTDPIKLSELWDDEVLYYRPIKLFDEAMEWNGVIYLESSKSCYQLSQKKGAERVDSKKAECEKEFLEKATLKYEKFSSFEEYKKKLLSCLDTQNEICLRGLISKTMMLGFGGEGLYDRRDYVFARWKKSDYKKVSDLIKKGVVSEGDHKRFPPLPSDRGMGHRGHFENKNGAWVLESFVTGD